MVFSDMPRAACQSPKYNFGLTPGIEPVIDTAPASEQGPCLVLTRAQKCDEPLIPKIEERERIRIGPATEDIMLYDPSRQRARARLTGDGNEQERASLALAAVALFVRLIAKKRGLYMIHAAAAARHGAAVLFTGDNETGKSTLVRTLVRDGWALISDDNLPVKIQDGTVCAVPVREAVNLSRLNEEQLRIFHERGFTPTDLEGFHLPPPAPADPVPVRTVFFPRWSDAAASPGPIRKAAALIKLFGACKTPLSKNDLSVYDHIIGRMLAQSALFDFPRRRGDPAQDRELLDCVARNL